jgi:hypothetical protein
MDKVKEYNKRINNFWDKCRIERKRILDDLEIAEPVCGFYCGLGWMPIVENALKKMIAAGWNKDLYQVKQKFCGLRIYIGSPWDNEGAVNDIIKEAESKAAEACESCGKPHGLEIPRAGQAMCEECYKYFYKPDEEPLK